MRREEARQERDAFLPLKIFQPDYNGTRASLRSSLSIINGQDRICAIVLFACFAWLCIAALIIVVLEWN